MAEAAHTASTAVDAATPVERDAPEAVGAKVPTVATDAVEAEVPDAVATAVAVTAADPDDVLTPEAVAFHRASCMVAAAVPVEIDDPVALPSYVVAR